MDIEVNSANIALYRLLYCIEQWEYQTLFSGTASFPEADVLTMLTALYDISQEVALLERCRFSKRCESLLVHMHGLISVSQSKGDSWTYS